MNIILFKKKIEQSIRSKNKNCIKFYICIYTKVKKKIEFKFK